MKIDHTVTVVSLFCFFFLSEMFSQQVSTGKVRILLFAEIVKVSNVSSNIGTVFSSISDTILKIEVSSRITIPQKLLYKLFSSPFYQTLNIRIKERNFEKV